MTRYSGFLAGCLALVLGLTLLTPTAVDAEQSDDGDNTAPLPLAELDRVSSSGPTPQSLFGASSAISGDEVLVGQPSCVNQCQPSVPGRAFLFSPDGNGGWAQTAELSADDTLPNEEFGVSVALEGDTAVVGAMRASVDGTGQQGAVYVFAREPDTGEWTQADKLTAQDGQSLDRFGRSLALEGDTLLIGADGATVGDVLSQGAVYVFERDPDGAFTERDELIGSMSAFQDNFGQSLALDGDRMLIGAPNETVDGESRSGAAYAFERNPVSGTWAEQERITASDTPGRALFGAHVALSQDVAFVAAPEADAGGNSSAGAVYALQRDAGTDMWVEFDRLHATDASWNHQFGSSLGTDGGTLLVGAHTSVAEGDLHRGAVYRWESDGNGSWYEHEKLTYAEGGPGDEFGAAITMGDGLAVLGAQYASLDGTPEPGAAFIYGTPDQGLLFSPDPVDVGNVPVGSDSGPRDVSVYNAEGTPVTVSDVASADEVFSLGTGTCGDVPFTVDPGEACTLEVAFTPQVVGAASSTLELTSDASGTPHEATVHGVGASHVPQAKLTAAGGQQGDGFHVVGVSGDTALIGAASAGGGGSATWFDRDPDTGRWQEGQTIQREGGEHGDRFGESAEIHDDLAFVGAPRVDLEVSGQGAVYVYERDNDSSDWELSHTLEGPPSDDGGFGGPQFGSAVAFDGQTLFVGALGDGDGLAYVYERTEDRAWSEPQILTPFDEENPSSFGQSLAVQGDRAVVGASATNVDGMPLQGSAYSFTRDENGEWLEDTRLVASDGQNLDRFGYSVALDGDTALVGAPPAVTAGQPGAVYAYAADDWTEQTKLEAQDASDDQFGQGVALSGDLAVIGAPHRSVGTHRDAGHALVFERAEDGTWTEQFGLAPYDPSHLGQFGVDVALDEDQVLVGANSTVEGMTNHGAAYVFGSSGVNLGLTISPDPVNFGTVAVGETTGPRSITVINTAATTVEVSDVTELQAPFSLTGGTCGDAPFGLHPGEACTLAVTIAPDEAGGFNQTLELDSGDVVDQVEVTGEAAVRELTVEPATFDFGQVTPGATSEPRALQVTNTSDELTVTVPPVAPLEAPFVLEDDTCGLYRLTQTRIAPGDSCTLELSFAPTAVGDAHGTVTIDSNALAGAVEVTLTGTGHGPIAHVDPDRVSASTPEGESTEELLTIGNTGNGELEWEFTEDGEYGTASEVEGEPRELTHSNSTEILEGNSLACSSSAGSSQNQFLRVFELSEFDLVRDFEVEEVTFGVQVASTDVDLSVNLYTLEGPLHYDNLTLIGSNEWTVRAQELSLVTVAVEATVPVDSTLVAEIEVPSLQPSGHGFVPGSNDHGETAPSYIAAPDCGAPQPVTHDALGFPDVHLVMSVSGYQVAAPECGQPDWLSKDPDEGVLDPGAERDVTVAFSPGDLAAGAYDANLCVGSNDPLEPLAVVPVELTVTDEDEPGPPDPTPTPTPTPSPTPTPDPTPTPTPSPTPTPDPTPEPPEEPEADGLERIAAPPGRVEVAIAASQHRFGDGEASAVVLARADAYPDALAGTTLAAEVDAPLLLTSSDQLLDNVATEIARVLGDEGAVYLTGGTAALDETVEDAVDGLGYELTRLGGDTRFETAGLIAEALGERSQVLVTTGLDFPDALTAGAAAAANDGVVLLSADEDPHDVVDDYLDGFAGGVTAVGGPATRAYPDAEAVMGETRDETAVAVAEAFFDEPTAFGVARRDDYPDALSGGAHIAAYQGPLLLTYTDQVPTETTQWLTGTDVTGGYVYGGAHAITDEVIAELERAAGP